MTDTVVRSRRPGDVAACIELLRVIHETAGYPTYWPDDPGSFVSPPDELEAWVAEGSDGAVRGHVALHDAGHGPACDRALAASNLTVEGLVAVGRLFVAGEVRGHGIGAALLAEATASAHRHGLRPFLNVVRTLEAAIAMYDRRRWENLGPLHLDFRDGRTLDTVVYLGPPPPTTMSS